MGCSTSNLESNDDEECRSYAKVETIVSDDIVSENVVQEWINPINVKDDRLLEAYIHDIDILLQQQYIIPQSICDLCFLFYHIPLDNFESAGYKITISGDNKTIIENRCYFNGHLSGYINSYQSHYQTAYGSEIIMPRLSKIYKWQFQIIKDYCFGSIYVGIDTLESQMQHTNFAGNLQSLNYSLCSNGKKYSHDIDQVYGEEFTHYWSERFVFMTLDFTGNIGVLSFNNIPAFKDIPKDRKYKSAISLFSESAVKLKKYEQL